VRSVGDEPLGDDTVLLTGAAGLIGTWLRRTAPPGIEICSVVHRRELPRTRSYRCDLRDASAVVRMVEEVAPTVVLHAAYAMDEGSIVDCTRNVVEAAARTGSCVVHTSTDVVFSGDGSRRDEASPPDPIADYGRWKAEAERIVQRAPVSGAVVRLPLVVSVDPPDQGLQRMRTGAATGEPSTWFTDEVRQPALASDLAAALWRIIALGPAERSGVWQLPGPESLTRHQLAQRTATALGIDAGAIRAATTPEGMVRPRHIDLGADRAIREIGWAPDRVMP